MARRGKTVVKGGPDSRLMMEAERQGADRVSQAKRDEIAQIERERERIDRGVQQGFQQATTMRQQAQGDRRMDIAEGDQLIRQSEAQKNREFQREMSTQAQGSREKMFRERMELEAADRGLERAQTAQTDEAGVSPEGPEQTDTFRREAAAGVESTGSGWVPNEERVARTRIDALKATAAKTTADARLLAAKNYEKINRLRMAQKEDSEEFQKALKEANRRIDDGYQRVEAAANGELSDDQWARIRSDAVQRGDSALFDEASDKVVGDRTMGFLKNQAALRTLELGAATGDFPDPKKVDMSHPYIQQWVQMMTPASEWLRSVGANNMFRRLDAAKAERLRRKVAAMGLIASIQAGAQQPTPAAPGQPQGQQNVGPGPSAPGQPQQQPGPGPQPTFQPDYRELQQPSRQTGSNYIQGGDEDWGSVR